MVDSRASPCSPSPSPGGRGGGGGQGRGRGRGRGKRAAAAVSPLATPPADADSPAKRSKAEAGVVQPSAAAGPSTGPAAEDPSSRPPEEEWRRPRPWAKLLVQCSQTPHSPIIGNQIFVGKAETCDICLDDHTVSRILCILRYLEQGGPCELEVTGENGRVHVNGGCVSKGTKVALVGGDEIVFGECDKHAYIFQHPLSDKVTKAVPISTLALLETPTTNVKSIHLENRACDSSADAMVKS